jgi:nitrous oxidase accessory protein NosD
MNLKLCSIVLSIITGFYAVSAERTVWYVHPDSALNSIQTTLDSCSANDIVLVGPGTYVENITWPNTQGIKLISERGYEATVIDGDSVDRVIYLPYAFDTNTVIRGFTLRRGFPGTAFQDRGGGIFCDFQASPTISENMITHCSANAGGAIYAIFSKTVIRDNIIRDNYSIYSGAGIYLLACSTATVSHNLIELNNSSDSLTGIMLNANGSQVVGNVIRYNTGHGIGFLSSYAAIESCTIMGNSCDGINGSGVETPLIHYNNIFGNGGYGVYYAETVAVVDAEYNWWGDAAGPYHPDSNPGGLGDEVSDYVDFTPWLGQPWLVQETQAFRTRVPDRTGAAVIAAGPLPYSLRNKGNIYNSMGRRTSPEGMKPGVYFIVPEGKDKEKIKIIKIR